MYVTTTGSLVLLSSYFDCAFCCRILVNWSSSLLKHCGGTIHQNSVSPMLTTDRKPVRMLVRIAYYKKNVSGLPFLLL